jgi:hypothetical protein
MWCWCLTHLLSRLHVCLLIIDLHVIMFHVSVVPVTQLFFKNITNKTNPYNKNQQDVLFTFNLFNN